jgi:iron-sulfur cluster assembly protein
MSEQATEMIQEIVITDSAIAELGNIRAENEIPEEYGLRIAVKGGGCSGMSYSLGFDTENQEMDEVLTVNGVKVIVDSKSMYYLAGSILDFADNEQGRGFVFNNPNSMGCSCGSSGGSC